MEGREETGKPDQWQQLEVSIINSLQTQIYITRT
jgi:hypothetical protein